MQTRNVWWATAPTVVLLVVAFVLRLLLGQPAVSPVTVPFEPVVQTPSPSQPLAGAVFTTRPGGCGAVYVLPVPIDATAHHEPGEPPAGTAPARRVTVSVVVESEGTHGPVAEPMCWTFDVPDGLRAMDLRVTAHEADAAEG